MNQVKFPQGYQQVMPYLIVKNAAGFSTFMQKVFHAKEVLREMRDDSIIRHAEVKIGDSTIMFADSTEQYAPQNAGFFVYVENADTAIARSLDEGAKVIQEATDRPYGRSGGIIDPYGNTWWVTSIK